MLAGMGEADIDDLLATIRRLPLAKRLRLIERAAHEAAEDTPSPPPASPGSVTGPSLLGLMADEPDLVDEVCRVVYLARSTARMRIADE